MPSLPEKRAHSFAGDDQVELDVLNNGRNGSGTRLENATVTVEPSGSYGSFPVPNGGFFIRTFDQEGSGKLDDADLSNQSGRPVGSFGTYVRFGNLYQWTFVGTVPDNASQGDPLGPHPHYLQSNYPSSGRYSDGQMVVGSITVIGAAGVTENIGVSDSVYLPLAFAVVPRGQPVSFDVTVSGSQGPSFSMFLDEPIPEPATAGLVAAGMIALTVRRRRT